MTKLHASTVFAQFMEQAKRDPAKVAILHPQIRISYGQIAEAAEGFAAQMEAKGVAPGTKVCLHSRALTTNLNMALAASQLGARLLNLQPDQAPDASTLHFHSSDAEGPVPAGSHGIDAAWSTGNAKSRAVAEGFDLLAQLDAMGEYLPQQTVWASAMRPDSPAFVMRALAVLARGGTIVPTTNEAFPAEAQVNVFSAPAADCGRLLRGGSLKSTLRLADVTDLVFTAEQASSLLGLVPGVRQVLTLPGGVAHVNYFGAQPGQWLGHAIGGEIEIVDGGGKLADADAQGQIRLKPLGGEAMRTGDFGRRSVNGVLFVTAPASHAATINGHAQSLAEIDKLITAVDGVKDAATFKNPKPGAVDELFAFIVIEEGYNKSQLKAIIRSRISEKFGAAFAPRVIQPVAGLPRGPDGLPDRKACAAFFLMHEAQRAAAREG